MTATDGCRMQLARGVHLRALTSSTTWRGTAREAGEEAGESVSRQAMAGPRPTLSHNIHGTAGRPLRPKACRAHMTWTPSYRHTTEVDGHRHRHNTSLCGSKVHPGKGTGRAPRRTDANCNSERHSVHRLCPSEEQRGSQKRGPGCGAHGIPRGQEHMEEAEGCRDHRRDRATSHMR